MDKAGMRRSRARWRVEIVATVLVFIAAFADKAIPRWMLIVLFLLMVIIMVLDFHSTS